MTGLAALMASALVLVLFPVILGAVERWLASQCRPDVPRETFPPEDVQ